MERIRQWALAQGADPGSALRKALKYTLKRWDGLTVFLRAPEVPLANNYVARQLRDKGGGSQEPLRQRVPARPRGGRSLLLPHRDGAPARGGPAHDQRRAALAALENPGTITLPYRQD